jgi:hypothetical protein
MMPSGSFQGAAARGNLKQYCNSGAVGAYDSVDLSMHWHKLYFVSGLE